MISLFQLKEAHVKSLLRAGYHTRCFLYMWTHLTLVAVLCVEYVVLY